MHYCKPKSVRDSLPQEAQVARRWRGVGVLALWFWRPPINGLLSWRPWKPHRSKVGSGDQPTYHQHFQPYRLDIAEQDLAPIAQRNRLISTVQHYSNTMSALLPRTRNQEMQPQGVEPRSEFRSWEPPTVFLFFCDNARHTDTITTDTTLCFDDPFANWGPLCSPKFLNPRSLKSFCTLQGVPNDRSHRLSCSACVDFGC